ncbi:MAG: hypothetical protein PWP57_496, partial [Candidatus Atribacteria bacterium]|nr:hypothetical protein [Candidatus Atribacteria bacterium]
MARIAGIDLP